MFLAIVPIFPNIYEKAVARGFLGGLLGPVHMQPGCLGCSLAMESDPDELVLTESWQSEEDLLRRLRSDGYSKLLETMEISVKKPEVFIYEVGSQEGLERIERVRMAHRERNPYG